MTCLLFTALFESLTLFESVFLSSQSAAEKRHLQEPLVLTPPHLFTATFPQNSVDGFVYTERGPTSGKQPERTPLNGTT